VVEDVITARLHRRIQRDFPEPDQAGVVTDELRELAHDLRHWQESKERIMTAAILFARGDLGRLRSAMKIGRSDWRDLLMAGELGNEGWDLVMDRELGPR
jgi:hypothetical protein